MKRGRRKTQTLTGLGDDRSVSYMTLPPRSDVIRDAMSVENAVP